ncbi:unnamed protein product [Auanema sp. JU1783]|nr:unnamed protein product [Auanema sp. JU1783]
MEKPPKWQTWGIGLSIVSVCSYAAPLGILVLPCLSASLYERIMTFLIALGIGALSGSTMFIMLPQAFNLQSLDDFQYHDKAGIILAAVYLFFSVDRILQYILEIRRRKQAKRKVHQSTLASIMNENPAVKIRSPTEETTISHNDSDISKQYVEHHIPNDQSSSYFKEKKHDKQIENMEKAQLVEDLEVAMVNNALVRTFSQRRQVAVITTVDDIEYENREEKVEKKNGQFLEVVNNGLQRTLSLRKSNSSIDSKTSNKQLPKDDDEISVSVKIVEKKTIAPANIEVASVAYMIIFGSSANNFVDGMSMGAAFSDNLMRGMSIGIAVISQQFPQELGTLAILVKSGLGLRRTLLFNLIPIILSYLGFVIGVLLDNVDSGYDDYIFAISSGMYMYIFLGTLIPEIRDSTNELIKQNLKESILVTALQVLGIGSGITLMYAMSIVDVSVV